MRVMKWLDSMAPASVLAASLLAVSSPAAAQEAPAPIIATNVAFFDNVQMGDLTLSAVNIFHDTRCADPEFCFRNNQFAISVILFTDEGLKEVILRLFETTPLPGGGTLSLTNTGTPPSGDGAIALEQYQLELVYQPAPRENASASERGRVNETAPPRERSGPAVMAPARA